jgi:CO/xanthine dehydrogenase FAD-binding subunit
VPYAGYHTGYKQTVAAPGELVARVIIPRADRTSLYRKVGPRRAQAISKVCFAGCEERSGGKVTAVRVALGGVAPVPLRVPSVEQAIAGGEPVSRILQALDAAIAPIDDVRSTSRYRRRVAANLLEAFLALLGRPAGRQVGPDVGLAS